jgi:hypothetical protein
MEIVFTIFKYFVFGFFFLIVLLFALAAIFGKRIKKQWEYEAEFRDTAGKEFGEFDIEMSRIEKEEPDFTFKSSFRMRHESLREGQEVQVYVEDLLAMEGIVEKAGRVYLDRTKIVNAVSNAEVGQRCRVMLDDQEMFSATLEHD